MQTKSIILAAVAVFGLSACLESNLERGVAGAGAGVVAANVLGTDPAATALAGAAAGLFCDDVGVCRPARN
jgi:osmotically inducible lipoprotein OsmB